MRSGPLVPVLADRFARAWPGHAEGGAARYGPLGETLTTRYATDAHLAAYAVPAVARRLDKGALAEIEGGVCMALAIFDVDDADAHAAECPSTPEWWAALQVRLALLEVSHPGAFAYRTRGGARIVYRLPEPIVLRSDGDADAWKRWYVACVAYLAETFGIAADPACSDWTRLYRLPHATRDNGGQPEDLPTLGDAHAVGTWAPACPTFAEVRAQVEAEARERERARKATATHAGPPAHLNGSASPRAKAAHEAEIRRVAGAAQGTRNATLNSACFNLAQLHAVGELPDVLEDLVGAAIQVGVPEHEARATARSGWAAGLAKPRAPSTRQPVTRSIGRARAGTPAAVGLAEGAEMAENEDAVPLDVLEGASGREDQESDAGQEYGQDQADDRPVIRNGLDVARVLRETIDALRRRGKVYVRGRELVRVVTDAGSRVRNLARPPGEPIIVPVTRDAALVMLTQAARWENLRKQGDKQEWVPGHPAPWVASSLLALGSWDLPLLESVAAGPTIRPDGTVLQDAGHDADSGVLVVLGRATFPRVPEAPTQADAVAAYQDLCEPFAQFPFTQPKDLTTAATDLAATIAAVLTLVGRSAIRGPVPGFAVRANTRGSGKGLLVSACVTIATGRHPSIVPPADGFEEERKRLLALALEGTPAVLIDNVRGAYGSPALDAALTSGEVKDRKLGATEMASAPWRAVVFLTGNNLSVRGDLARRVIPIDLESPLENPEERDDFQHPELLAWVIEHRPRLLVAALTILRAYFVAGCPRQKCKPLGSFEAWSRLIRGALLWVGAGDPAATMARWRDGDGDTERGVLRDLLEAWHRAIGADPVTVPRLLQVARDRLLENDSDLKDALLATVPPKFRPREVGDLDRGRLGKALASLKGRVVGGLRLVRETGLNQGRAQWSVERAARSVSGGLGGLGGVKSTNLARESESFPMGVGSA